MTAESLVYIVDDEPDVREALKLLVKSIGLRSETHASAQAFLESYKVGQPGCLVLDVRMPGMSGIELQQKLKTYRINLPVIIMTGHGDIAMAVRAMKAGALDFIEKPFNDQILLDRIQQAIEYAEKAKNQDSEKADIRRRLETLTPREREVMQLVVIGKFNKVIGSELGVSTRTVEIHRARIMEKMGATCLSDLVRMAIEIDEI